MRKLQISKNYRAIIETVIRENSKFRGHEELIDIFCDAIYRKSYLLMDAIRDTARLKRHLSVICDDCMIQIIKEKQKYDETSLRRKFRKTEKNAESIVSVKKEFMKESEEIELEAERYKNKKDIVNLREEIQRCEKYDFSDNMIDPLDFCQQKRVSEHTLDKLIQIVKMINMKFPKKRYYEIFALRYIRKYNQTEIAQEMKISQIELSKRFVELVKLTRENI